ncbi:glucosaminidase domain-containing protein [Mucilaginibacter sp.]|uniref:glucosaminidase domain-containing protein n=1 Tax=Mucilaginibacter sp. TaxID=1882438 RepID=UPI00283D94CA|nr:glucosaminidase domain-containing protein [Mucilaginibacter sp.]MDR3696979.1 glucosaminidase domain-containing protein [Mucilaginibacter sp.]
MRKTVYLFIGLAFFTSCSAHRVTVSNRAAKQNNRHIRQQNDGADYTPLTSLQYIARYKAIAIQEMNSYSIPASITLAQGLFESGSGNGELARVANNHFGIKSTPNWTGNVYYKDDDNKNDAFRVYDSPEESFRDHSLFLKRKNYKPLFDLDITDYKGWCRGLKKAGYATNPNYPSILIGIIEKYNLQQYDNPGHKPVEIKTQGTALLTEHPASTVAVQDSAVQANPGNKTYTVKQGDTLYNISKRFGLSVDDLKSLNNLDGSGIKIGQVLVVVK